MSDHGTAVDIGSWFTTLARNWWVIAGLIVVGVVVGVVVTLAQPKVYTAAAAVYIGQTTDANGNPMAGLNSNTRASVQLLASEVVLAEAAKRTGMDLTVSRLREQTTVETPTSPARTTTSAVNIIVINVTDTDKERAAAAANALAEVLIENIESGVTEKIALLEDLLTKNQKEYDAATARSASAQEALDTIARGDGSAPEKATAAAPYLAVVQGAATQQDALTSVIQKLQLQLLVARQVETPRVLHEAGVPDSPSAPSLPMNAAVGALAGLVIGIVVAFARHRLADRRAARPAAG